KRATVPALPANRSACSAGQRPPAPSTRTMPPSRSASSATPRRARQSSMRSVSSAHRTPSSSEGPTASAASSSARLVMLLEPGTGTTASGGSGGGSTSAVRGRSGTVEPVPCTVTRSANLLQPAPGGGTGVDDAPDGAGVAPGHGVHQGGEMLG